MKGRIIIKDKIKIIIIEDNKELNNFIVNYLRKNNYFTVVGIAYDGNKGMELIEDINIEIDVIMLDIVLPIKDGISILEEIKNKNLRNKNKPIIMMFTSISSECIINRVLELGVDYLILKPFDLDILTKRILQIYEYKISKIKENLDDSLFLDNSYSPYTSQQLKNEEITSPEKYIIKELKNIGISPNLKGYIYLKTAILKAIEDKDVVNSITKILYPTIAKKHNTTPACVERAIRHAINIAWEKRKKEGNIKDIEYLLNYNDKPTNSYFILSISEAYRSLK